MATAEKQSTRDQVEALYKDGKGASAKEIADQLGKSVQAIYSHIRKIDAASGNATPRKRGRPPKAQATETAAEAPKIEAEIEAPKAQTRPRPAPKTASKPQAAVATNGNGNGHHAPSGDRMNVIRQTIEEQLAEARRDVARFEKMLAAFDS